MHRTAPSVGGRRRAVAAGALAAVALVVASGCGLGGGTARDRVPTSTSTTSTSTSTTRPAPDPEPSSAAGSPVESPGENTSELRERVLRDGVPLTSGDVTLVVLPVAPHAGEPRTQDDGSARWEPAADDAGATASATSPTLLVAAAAPLDLDLLLDGTVVVRRGDAPVAGLSATGAGRLTGDGDVLELRGDGTAGVWLATTMVEDLDWGEREGGRSLAVTPSDWARSGGLAADELVPAQVVAAEPEAGTSTMRDQLACHQLGAPDKATWNLEPWRPDVGPLEVLVARCNPT
ncbi:DUF2599 domain-containing protein [Cellulomonas sp. DKR-3]|uniref:DUF2599 domain-containing protein n=1 Tax=Cellulomonas fulva TaxID=2835530 RepID=A0ABS5TY70_9CELL|nr:DUF2599 domain-containing protein [Cellulomonas fulva]MBT0994059.1 DUF2599 domain-containing protein [Cellulomonas fulva]